MTPLHQRASRHLLNTNSCLWKLWPRFYTNLAQSQNHNNSYFGCSPLFRPSTVKNCEPLPDTADCQCFRCESILLTHACDCHWVQRNSRIKYIGHTDSVFPYSPQVLTEGTAQTKPSLKAVRGTLASGTWTEVIAKTWACVCGAPISKAEHKPNTHHRLLEPWTAGCQRSQRTSNLIYAKTKPERQLLLMGIKIISSQAA